MASDQEIMSDTVDMSSSSEDLSTTQNTGQKRKAGHKNSDNKATKKQKTAVASKSDTVDDDDTSNIGNYENLMKTIKFGKTQAGLVKVEPITIKHLHHGPAPHRVIPSEHEGVYAIPAQTATSQTQDHSSDIPQDDLVSEIAATHASQLDHMYDATMYDEDRRISDHTSNNQTRAKSSKSAKSKDDEDDDDDDEDATFSRTSRGDLDTGVPPVSEVGEFFRIIFDVLKKFHFVDACKPFMEYGIRVNTMCSGTESPIISMQLINEAMVQAGYSPFPIDHLASAEIEPFKQAYIQRNHLPRILFRDVTEFLSDSDEAHTAFGGVAKLPQFLDILVAGSSCIDYSALNVSKKAFGEAGKSFDTFTGVMAYAKRFRPPIIVLENVRGANWSKMRDYLDDMGYYGVPLMLDSKDFGVPQTRNRGYMVAFERDRAQDIGLHLKDATRVLVKCVAACSRRASAPYTDFIWKDDDPELKLAMEELKNPLPINNMDWAACRLRYALFRTSNKLGNGRPFSKWKAGGKSQPLDYVQMDWARAQRERILDTLDIDLLGYLSQRHYDMTYKSRFIELSQNVDRDLDRRQWGIVSCITPSGLPWHSLRGAPVFGKEVLALQGMPVEDMSFNRENSRQLQDLAGNAMTTTVVGVVIFSAIVASCVEVVNGNHTPGSQVTSMIKDFASMSIEEQKDTICRLSDQTKKGVFSLSIIGSSKAAQHMQTLAIIPNEETISTNDVKQLAVKTMPVCKCESMASSYVRNYLRCEECGHTVCVQCAGNPSHHYSTEIFTSKQSPEPEEFIHKISKALPLSLTLQVSADSNNIIQNALKRARHFKDHEAKADIIEPSQLSTEDALRYTNAVNKALRSTVYFSSVKRGSVWRVIFEAEAARLELRVSLTGNIERSKATEKDVSCVWLFFAKPSKAEPAISIVRDLLNRPAARMIPNKDSILQGLWQIWDPSMQYGFLDIKAHGHSQPAWERNLGLQQEPFQSLQVYSGLAITESQDGNENLDDSALALLQSLCGVYKSLPQCGTACGSLHVREPVRGKINSPEFLFLDPKPLQNAYMDRMVFSNTHHRLPDGVDRPVAAELVKAWRHNNLTVDSDNVTTVPCRLVDCWFPTDGMHFAESSTQQRFLSKTLANGADVQLTDECDIESPLIVCDLPITEIPQSTWSMGEQYQIRVIDRPGALKDFQWLLKRIALEIGTIEGEIILSQPVPHCSGCGPTPPRLEWHYTRNANSKTKEAKAIIKPFEDREAATVYERALLARPDPISAVVYMHDDKATLVISQNITTMAHRLHTKIDLNREQSKIIWRVVHNDKVDNFPRFPVLKLSKKIAAHGLWPIGDEGYDNNQTATKPKLFKRDLWDTQRKALAWMYRMETGCPWQEWDAEICDIPAMNLQLQVEGSAEVTVQGGIVADEVGAGKTTTSLALVARGLEDLRSASVPAKSNSTKIKSQATLILVPNNIICQWQDEIEACLGKEFLKKKVITLKVKDFKITAKQLQDAEIILGPWEIFNQDQYWNNFSNVCCAPNVPQKIDRAFKQWLDEAVSDLEIIVSKCGADLNLQKFLDHRKLQKDQKKQKYSRFEVFNPKILQTKKTLDPDLQQELNKMQKDGPAWCPDAVEEDQKKIDKHFETVFSWKPNGPVPVLLHFFDFERLIVDEFTYPDARVLLAIQKLTAKKRWMLSGTPPLTNVESINCMAALVGTQVSSEKETNMSFSFKNARSVNINDKTYGEEFRERLDKRSPIWYTKRNERSQLFTKTLIRQTEAKQAAVKKIEKYVVSFQSPLETCIYNKSFQVISTQNLRFGVNNGKCEKPTDEHFIKTLQSAGTPEEALLSCHANFLERYLKSSDTEAIEEFVKDRKESTRQLYDEILTCMQRAFSYWQDGDAKDDNEETNPHLTTYLYSILNGSFDDPCVSDLLSRAAAYARENPYAAAPKPATGGINERRKELQSRATELNTKSIQLVEQTQQLRLLLGIQSLVSGNSDVPCANCQDVVDISQQTILGQCGHLVCARCLASDPNADCCPVPRCFADAKDCRTSARSYAECKTSAASAFSTKLETMAETILAIDKKDKILVFVQFEAHLKRLLRLFDEKNIKYLDGSRRANITVKKFQDNVEPEKRVLILQIDSTDSAGWNLQAANHVMFVSPFLAKTEYDYQATMTQAVGRSFRFGQQKDVTVYHFVSAGTMDVNIIQARNSRKLVRNEVGEYEFVAFGDLRAEGQEDLRGPGIDAVGGIAREAEAGEGAEE